VSGQPSLQQNGQKRIAQTKRSVVKTHVVQTFLIPAPELEMGQSITAIAVALDQYGAPIDKGLVTWSSNFPKVAVVQPTTGQILVINSGMTQIIATVAGKKVIGPSQSHNLAVPAREGATNICA
jgi:uncharacterized protein YjdB